MTPNLEATARHEAGHCASAFYLHVGIDRVEILGERPGSHGSITYADLPDVGWAGTARMNFISSLCGYIAEGRENWPPPWADAIREPLESLGRCIELFGITPDEYAEMVDLAVELSRQPQYVEAVDFITRALLRLGTLTGDDVDMLLLPDVPNVPKYPVYERQDAVAAAMARAQSNNLEGVVAG